MGYVYARGIFRLFVIRMGLPPPPIVSGCDIDGCGINLYLKTNLVADWSAFSHPFPGFMESVTD